MFDVKERIRKIHVGENLQTLRLKAHLTQDALGKELSFTQSKISDLEMKESISDELLQPFATFYGVSLDFLRKFNFADAEKAMVTSTFNKDVNVSHAENTTGNESFINKTYDTENDNSTHTTTHNPLEKVSELYERLLASKNKENEDLRAKIAELEALRK